MTASRPDLAARNRGNGGPYEDAEWCRARFLDDLMTFSEMASEAGCSLRTIARWVHLHGIEVPTAAQRSLQRGTQRKPGPASTCACGSRKSRGTRTCMSCHDRGGDRNPRWLGSAIGNRAAHQRVRALRGKATSHSCRHCEGPAEHWAYDHCDPDERPSADGPYSLDPNHYMPLCVRCHKRFDLDVLRRAAA